MPTEPPFESTLDELVYTPEQVAAALKLKSANWLEEAARRRQIPHTRIGRSLRFTRDQVEAIVREKTVNPLVATLPFTGSTTAAPARRTRLRNLRNP